MKTFKEILAENIVWFITTLVAVGAALTTLTFQGKSIDDLKGRIEILNARINVAEERNIEIAKMGVKLDILRCDVTDIKAELKEMRKEIRSSAVVASSDIRFDTSYIFDIPYSIVSKK